jgi:uncharacterized protein YegP (UPF0339 family)
MREFLHLVAFATREGWLFKMYFTIEKASKGYRAHLYGGNNRLVFWTEVYTAKAGAENAIQVAKGSFNAPVYDRT